MRSLARILILAALLASGGVAVGQTSKTPTVPPAPVRPDAAASKHGAGELDCAACHRSTHQSVLRLAAGTGGRGAPPTPDRMFAVRVQCVACHVTSTASPGGETFVPSEQGCTSCHGERYGAMLTRWREGFGRMRQTVATKVTAARTALAKAPGDAARTKRVRSLVDDAEFNLRYVTLGNGAHNVFYAANLLRRANGWADEAATILGHALPRTDDALVRGGYCAVLCHEPAGRPVRDTVTFRGQRLPHARHVADLGATCTTCHSADLHRTLSASPATCSGCHHNPANERCETCHRAQASFYRGQTRSAEATVAPNRMADAVACTGCHDWSHKHSRAAVRQKCEGCHDASYLPLMTEWTTGFDQDLKGTAAALREADRALAGARQSGRTIPAAEALLKQAHEAHALVRAAGAVHNPLAADSILAAAREKARQARQQAAR